MSGLWPRLIDAFSPIQIIILKACAVIAVPCLIVLGIDRWIVQPRQAADTTPADSAPVSVEIEPPKIKLGLEEQVKRTRAELDALRLERERQARLRREQREQGSEDSRDPR